MKKTLIWIGMIIAIIIITGCSIKKKENNTKSIEKEEKYIDKNKSNHSNEVTKTMKVFINEKEYIIHLEDNETSREFITILPLELKMQELNGNEKYIYLDTSLPTNPSNPEKILAGDVMLFEDNCLVIFYKTFDTSYSYTKIGHIDNLPDLGKATIMVHFEK